MGSRSDGVVVSSALREQLLKLSRRVSKKKDAILFRRGDSCAGAFLICKGRVRLLLEGVSSAFPPRILGAGCVAGLPAAVAGLDYSLTAQVVEPAELAWVARDALCDCLKKNSQLCFEVMDILSHELSATRAAIKRSGSHAHN